MENATALNEEDENMVMKDNILLDENMVMKDNIVLGEVLAVTSVRNEKISEKINDLVLNDDNIITFANDDGTLYDLSERKQNNATNDALVLVSDNTENNNTIDSVAIDDTIDQKKVINNKDNNVLTNISITNNVNHVTGQNDNPIDINDLFKSIQQMTLRFQAAVEQNEKFRNDLEESKKKEEQLMIQSKKEREESIRIQKELKNKYYRLETDSDVEIEEGDDAFSLFMKTNIKRKAEAAGTVTTNRKIENRVYGDDDNAVYIDLPYLADGQYEWISIVTVENRYNRHRLQVSDDYLPLNQTVTREDAKKRCRFLGLTIEDRNIDRVSIEMQNMRQSIRNTIKTTLYKFWIDIATQMGLSIINEPGRVIRDLDDVLFAIRTMQTQSDVRKVSLFGLYTVYLVCILFIWFF